MIRIGIGGYHQIENERLITTGVGVVHLIQIEGMSTTRRTDDHDLDIEIATVVRKGLNPLTATGQMIDPWKEYVHGIMTNVMNGKAAHGQEDMITNLVEDDHSLATKVTAITNSHIGMKRVTEQVHSIHTNGRITAIGMKPTHLFQNERTHTALEQPRA